LNYLGAQRDPDSGLLAIPKGHWSETALISWASPWCNRYGQSTPLNALYYDTLRDAAALSRSVGRNNKANSLEQTARQVKQAMNNLLYQPATGSYLGSTGLDEYCPPSPQAQAWALAYDVVPDSEQQRVADTLLNLISTDPAAPGIELYGTYWVLEGLARSGRISEAVDLTERIYGRLLDLNATTWWEHLNAHEMYNASLSHGWSGSPTWFLTTHVLGAQQTGPATWRVQPGVEGLDAAAGTLSLPAGNIAVRWTNHCRQPFRLEVTAPEHTSGEIVLPVFEQQMTVTLDETPVWQHGEPLADSVSVQQDQIVLTLDQGGTYALEADRETTCIAATR
jgi:alpha-L-rhamnosidase